MARGCLWGSFALLCLTACGGSGRAVPAPVEIDWPDAAVQGAPRVPTEADAGVEGRQPGAGAADAGPADAGHSNL